MIEPKDIMPPDPVEEVKPMTLTLYANGHLVPCEASDVDYDPNGPGVVVRFFTTLNCLKAGTGDPRIERVWGDKASGQLWFVRQPHPEPGRKYPKSGCVIIEDVIIPANEEEGVKFRCRANTEVFDWNQDDPIAKAGDEIILPVEWLGERA